MIAYEVLRIVNSKPLFAAEHYARMLNSVKSINPDVELAYSNFIMAIKNAIVTNDVVDGNVKLETVISGNEKITKLNAKVIPHHYPSAYDYKNGVNTVTFLHTRENPNSKIWNQQLRERTDEIISMQNVFEVIYINKSNFVTEGSRSNIFFLNNNQLISAKPEDILMGITRHYIIEAALKNGMELVEKNIQLSETENYDAAFISGTSPKILPIRRINEISYGINNKNLRILMSEYENIIDENIKNFSFE